MQIVSTITGVNQRPVNTRDGRSFTINEVHTADGITWQARADVYGFAQNLVGQQVEIIGRSEQKGQYLNYFLDQLTPLGAPQQAPVGQQPQYVPQSPAQGNPVAAAQQAAQRAQRIEPAYVLNEKDRSIHRQVAAKVAARISTTADEFWRNATDLARYFDTGEVPTSRELAEASAGDGYTYTDEDAPPFMPTI